VDLFPGDGLPEVSGASLTLECLASGLLHHGAIVVRGLIPANRVNELRTFCELGPLRYLRGTQASVDQGRMVDALVATYAEVGVLELAEAWIGEPPVGDPARVVVKRDTSGIRGGPGLRGIRMRRSTEPGSRALDVWTALTDCGDECPGLSVVPRRFETVFEPQYRVGPSTTRA
jgi:hypothetical protein